MATKPAALSSALAFGTDPESTIANERWQQAYDQLLQAVERRQEKPMFDPFWLKVAEAGVAPTRTGNYFETLGNTAAEIGKFQQEEQTKAEDLAKMRLELAGMGVERARQQWIAKGYNDLGPVGGQPTGAQAGAKTPAGAQAGVEEAPAREGEPEVSTSPTFKIGVASPVDEAAIIQQFRAAGKPVSDARLAIAEEKRKRIVEKEGYLFNGNTGEITIVPTGTLAEVNIPDKGLVKVPVGVKHALEALEFSNPKGYWKLVDQIVKGPARIDSAAVPNPAIQTRPFSIEAQEAAATPQVAVAPPAGRPEMPQGTAVAQPRPTAAPQVSPSAASSAVTTAPAGRLSQEEAAQREAQLKMQRELEIKREEAKIAAGLGAEAKRQEAMGTARGKQAVDEEAKFAMNADNAGKLFTAADTVVNAVKKSPDYFGVFNKPGIVNAIGATVAEAAKPGGKFTIIDVEQKVLQSMPGTTKENLLDREKAASALAEIELGYTQTYLAKQGAVTEGERKIVRAIPGGLSSSPKFLEIKSKLIRERAQYDMDLNTAYTEYLRAKPNGDAIDFKRNSPLYKEIHGAFERKTAALAETIPALPTKERKPEPTKNQALDYAESLRKRMQQ